MTNLDPLAARARGSVPLPLGIVAGWLVLYLLMMADGGWSWRGQDALAFGAPPARTLERFGAAVPALVTAGAWQRLLLSPWLHRSLLEIVLLAWFWTSAGGTLARLVGRARAWILFVLAGLGGALAHVATHADSAGLGGAGPFDAIVGALGATLVWGLGNPAAGGRRIVRSTLLSLLVVGVLTFLFARQAGAAAGALWGQEAALGGLGAGILGMLVLGPRRSGRAPSVGVRAAAWLALAAVLAAVAVQAPQALARARGEAAQRFLEQLEQTEYEAWWIAQNPTRASEAKRAALQRRLGALAGHAFLDGEDGSAALRAYVDALRPYARGDVPRPWETEARCRQAFRAWYDAYEAPLREEIGLAARSSARFFWESP